MVKSFVDRLKDAIRGFAPEHKINREDVFGLINGDPRFKPLLNKLKELVDGRAELIKSLRKNDLDISACLTAIEIQLEKEEITIGKR